MTPPETGSTATPGDSRATAPLTCTFGPQGPTLGDLIDAYLQDYQVRQFRSVSTARGRTAHLAAFFGRAARAAGLTIHVHSAAARGSPHIAVPSPPHIPLACRAHQSECGRTPSARGCHQGGTHP